jgi:hypothetical protein
MGPDRAQFGENLRLRYSFHKGEKPSLFALKMTARGGQRPPEQGPGLGELGRLGDLGQVNVNLLVLGVEAVAVAPMVGIVVHDQQHEVFLERGVPAEGGFGFAGQSLEVGQAAQGGQEVFEVVEPSPEAGVLFKQSRDYCKH